MIRDGIQISTFCSYSFLLHGSRILFSGLRVSFLHVSRRSNPIFSCFRDPDGVANIGHGLVCFVAIIPLERMFDYGGEQMAHYLGKELGDLLIITLNK